VLDVVNVGAVAADAGMLIAVVKGAEQWYVALGDGSVGGWEP
jgi:hypothetical protein